MTRARRLRRWLGGPTVVLLLYGAVALNPALLFAHELEVENLVLHSRSPLPARAVEVLRAAHARASRSPFFDANDRYDVYLCDTPALFAFFVPWQPDVGGVALTGLTGNVFIRPAHVEADRLVGPRGQEVEGVRTLTYFVTHEVLHVAMARRLGRLAYHRLEVWQQEGLADLYGKGGAFDFEAERERFRAGHDELSPAKSGLSLRHQLLVEALLREGLTVEAIASAPRDAAPIEARLSR